MTLTELDNAAVARAFDRAAAGYDDHAALQREVEARLLERVDYFELDGAGAPGRVLDLGCGPGRGLAGLGDRFPAARLVGLDRSAAMLRLAQARYPKLGTFIQGDMHQLPFARSRFDLVFSNLAVQWSTEEPRLFEAVRSVLRPGGLFLFTSFGPDTLRELRTAWAAVDEGPRVNEFPDMHDVGDALVSAGFREPVMDMEMLTLEYGDVLTLMQDLKGIGATNAAVDRPRGLTGRSRLRQVAAAYESFRRNDRYPASYEVIYGTAFAPPEGQPVRTGDGEVATFSIESLSKGRQA